MICKNECETTDNEEWNRDGYAKCSSVEKFLVTYLSTYTRADKVCEGNWREYVLFMHSIDITSVREISKHVLKYVMDDVRLNTFEFADVDWTLYRVYFKDIIETHDARYYHMQRSLSADYKVDDIHRLMFDQECAYVILYAKYKFREMIARKESKRDICRWIRGYCFEHDLRDNVLTYKFLIEILFMCDELSFTYLYETILDLDRSGSNYYFNCTLAKYLLKTKLNITKSFAEVVTETFAGTDCGTLIDAYNDPDFIQWTLHVGTFDIYNRMCHEYGCFSEKDDLRKNLEYLKTRPCWQEHEERLTKFYDYMIQKVEH